MGFDLLGDLFGQARRRKIEAAATQVLTGGTKPVAIDYGVLGTKIATAATVYLLGATLNHTLPATGGGILTGVGAAIVAAGPSALQSSGVFTALSPNTVSAIKGLGQSVSAVLAAPANARKAAFSAAVADEVQNALKSPEVLSQAADALHLSGQWLSTPQGLVPAASSQTPTPVPQTAQETPVAGQMSISTVQPDPAIASTGGNQ